MWGVHPCPGLVGISASDDFIANRLCPKELGSHRLPASAACIARHPCGGPVSPSKPGSILPVRAALPFQQAQRFAVAAAEADQLCMPFLSHPGGDPLTPLKEFRNKSNRGLSCHRIVHLNSIRRGCEESQRVGLRCPAWLGFSL